MHLKRTLCDFIIKMLIPMHTDMITFYYVFIILSEIIQYVSYVRKEIFFNISHLKVILGPLIITIL